MMGIGSQPGSSMKFGFAIAEFNPSRHRGEASCSAVRGISAKNHAAPAASNHRPPASRRSAPASSAMSIGTLIAAGVTMRQRHHVLCALAG
jgi:hypothetical protein